MNVQSLWTGNEYAWAEYRPKGVFPLNAKRVRLVKVSKRRVGGNDRLSSFATVTILDEDDKRFGKDPFEVRTRDIVDFWDSYEDERTHRQEERDKARRQMDEERVARQQKEAKENADIAIRLEEKGLPRSAIYSMSGSQIVLEREEVMTWLKVPIQ